MTLSFFGYTHSLIRHFHSDESDVYSMIVGSNSVRSRFLIWRNCQKISTFKEQHESIRKFIEEFHAKHDLPLTKKQPLPSFVNYLYIEVVFICFDNKMRTSTFWQVYIEVIVHKANRSSCFSSYSFAFSLSLNHFWIIRLLSTVMWAMQVIIMTYTHVNNRNVSSRLENNCE